MKKRFVCWLACSLVTVCISFAQDGKLRDLSPIQEIFQRCRHPRGPTALDDLRAYAQANGISDAEMAARLMELAQTGLDGVADAQKRHFAICALQKLPCFGRAKECEFLLTVMRTGPDAKTRLTALLAGLRMTPEKWEEWVQEALADKLFGELDRFQIYKNVFTLGRGGDEKTRQRVIEVLTEMRGKDSCRVNQNRLGGWIAELKGGDAWEAWLKEVVTGVGFYPANRKHAFNLAMQTGRNGDAETRQRVIEVFAEMCNDESLDVDRNALRQWIGELEKMP